MHAMILIQLKIIFSNLLLHPQVPLDKIINYPEQQFLPIIILNPEHGVHPLVVHHLHHNPFQLLPSLLLYNSSPNEGIRIKYNWPGKIMLKTLKLFIQDFR